MQKCENREIEKSKVEKWRNTEVQKYKNQKMQSKNIKKIQCLKHGIGESKNNSHS